MIRGAVSVCGSGMIHLQLVCVMQSLAGQLEI